MTDMPIQFQIVILPCSVNHKQLQLIHVKAINFHNKPA